MLPSIFNDNLFDDFFNFPFYDDKAERRAEKKLYGHHAHNLMKTDIKEKKDGYELEMYLLLVMIMTLRISIIRCISTARR